LANVNASDAEIRAVMTFGTEIGRTAVQVQMAVRKQVELMTGNRVKRVDVIVEGVKMPATRNESASTESSEDWPELPHTD
ncbi:MAG: Asp23/Gls24 family envelope stress response protein, partial [Opitutaceae bacterium]|nr:Asp23/Gls24 family envelope stress response protein [Opitutaceae bacterium]